MIRKDTVSGQNDVWRMQCSNFALWKCNPIDLQNVLFYKLLTIYLWAPSNAADRFSVSISWGQIPCSNFVSLRNCLMYRNGFRVLYLQTFARKNIEWKFIHIKSIIVDYLKILITFRMLKFYFISILCTSNSETYGV